MRRALFWTAVVGVAGLLVVEGVVASRATAGNGRRSLTPAWTLRVPPLSLVRARVEAGEPLIVATASMSVMEIGSDGRERHTLQPGGTVIASATGDLTGDGLDEVVVLLQRGPTLQALSGDLGRVLWQVALEAGQVPQRVLPVDLDGDKRREVVVARQGGQVSAYSPAGKPLWSWALPAGPAGEEADVRGLDDVKLGRARLVALARRDGQVALLDGRGQPVFQQALGEKLRRLRALELSEGDGVVFTGGDAGIVRRLDPPTRPGGAGSYQFRISLGLGESVTELRLAEIDGNPLSREVVAGGKKGAVQAAGGAAGNAGGRVSALAGFDVDGDGRDEIAAGTETGQVRLLTSTGEELLTLAVGAKVETLLVVPEQAGGRLLLVGAGSGLSAYRYGTEPPPAWYRPGPAVAVGLLVLGLVTIVLARFRHPVAPAPAAVTARDWRRQQLVEARAKVEALRPKARPEDVLERLAEIDRQLAALDRASSPAARPVVASPPPPRRR